MPSSLRARIALFVLMGAFLIPVGLSSLRGLTHVLTCSDRAATPFTIIIPKQGAPQLISSVRIGPDAARGLCGGLFLDMRARGESPGRVAMVVEITNKTENPWRGTVRLELRGDPRISLPVRIGAIEPGATAKDTIDFTLPQGSHEVDGSLLIGP